MAKRVQVRGQLKVFRDDEIYRLRADERWTYTRIGQHFGLSAEGVRQIFFRMEMKRARAVEWSRS